jgi:hypothetical protein
MMKSIRLNVRPLALVVVCACVGYFLGSVFSGIVFGVLIVGIATLFFH